MKRAWLLGILSLFVSVSEAARIRTPGECEVFAAPDLKSRIVCRYSPKTSIEIKSKSGDFYKAERTECSGYIPKTCLLKTKTSTRRSRRKRDTASEEVPTITSKSDPAFFHIGFRFAFETLSAKVPYSDTRSKGIGFSLGGTAQYLLVPTVRFFGGLSYHYQRLSRTLAGSELITDPGTEVAQKVHSAGLLIGASYGFSTSLFSTGGEEKSKFFKSAKKTENTRPLFWIDAGLELLQPVFTGQSSSTLPATSASAGRALYLISGLSTALPIGKNDLEFGLQFRLNLASPSGNSQLSGLLYVGFVL